MGDTVSLAPMPDRMNDPLAATAAAQAPRLRAFVRRQVEDLGEVDDIVQDVLFELVAAYRLMQPIEHVTAWLLRVARNRIIDRYRAGAREAALIDRGAGIDRGALDMTETMPEPDRVFDTWVAPLDAGPEAAYVRSVLIDELLAALNELPGEQRDVFMAHELDGRSFKELAAATGVSLNTLLGRKHAAVNYLRRRLRDMHSAFDH